MSIRLANEIRAVRERVDKIEEEVAKLRAALEGLGAMHAGAKQAEAKGKDR